MSRKVLFITIGMVALLGGSGAAALYVTGDHGAETPKDNPAGDVCTTIQTLVLKTPSRRLWLRKYIRMESSDGATRIKTALRVAGLLAKANTVDLIQVNVLDAKGPVLKSEMRGRAIGAEVIIGLRPQYLPDMKEPFVVRYYEGVASAEGRYYGERVSLELAEIQKLMGAMKHTPDKQDCAEPEKPATDAEGHEPDKKPGHGEQIVSEGHDKPAEHGEKPAEHGEKPAEHGEAPAAEEHGAPSENAHEQAPAEEKSILDSALGLIGLGGSEAPAESHETADQPGHEEKAAGEGREQPAEHGEKPAEHGEAPAAVEDATDTEGHAEAPVEEKSMLDSALGLVGLGGSETPAETHEAPAEGHETKADESADPAAGDHGEQPEQHAAAPEAEESMLDSALGLIGLGAEKPAAEDVKPVDHEASADDGHAAADDTTTPAGEHASDEKKPDGHGEGEKHDEKAADGGHDEKPGAHDQPDAAAVDKTVSHDAAPGEAEHPAEDAAAEKTADGHAAPEAHGENLKHDEKSPNDAHAEKPPEAGHEADAAAGQHGEKDKPAAAHDKEAAVKPHDENPDAHGAVEAH